MPRQSGGWYYDGMHHEAFGELFDALWDKMQLMESIKSGFVQGDESYLPKDCGVKSS